MRNHFRSMMAGGLLLLAAAWMVDAAGEKIDPRKLVTGEAAFGNAPTLKPGTYHKITVADLPQPFATQSSRNNAKIISRPTNAWPQVPAGFHVDLYVAVAAHHRNPQRDRLSALRRRAWLRTHGPGVSRLPGRA